MTQMKKLLKIATLALILPVALALSACGGKGGAGLFEAPTLNTWGLKSTLGSLPITGANDTAGREALESYLMAQGFTDVETYSDLSGAPYGVILGLGGSNYDMSGEAKMPSVRNGIQMIVFSAEYRAQSYWDSMLLSTFGEIDAVAFENQKREELQDDNYYGYEILSVSVTGFIQEGRSVEYTTTAFVKLNGKTYTLIEATASFVVGQYLVMMTAETGNFHELSNDYYASLYPDMVG